MKSLLYISIIAFTFIGCKRKQNNIKYNAKIRPESLSTEDTTILDPTDLGCLPVAYKHYSDQTFDPGTFNPKTYVYFSPKPGANIIDSLPIFTHVNILKEYPEFYLVCTPDAKSGYIKKMDLYLNKIFQSIDDSFFFYLIGITKYPPKKDIEENDLTCEKSLLKIVKIADKTNKILDVYTDSILGVSYDAKAINRLALKKANSLLRIQYSCMQDIETDEELYLIDNGTKLAKLIVTSGSGDGGYGSNDVLYIPIRVDKDKIVLAANGELNVDESTLEADIYPYPADCGIPIDELVVVVNTSDDADPNQKSSDDSPDNIITTTTASLYQWDGTELKKIKTLSPKTSSHLSY